MYFYSHFYAKIANNFDIRGKSLFFSLRRGFWSSLCGTLWSGFGRGFRSGPGGCLRGLGLWCRLLCRLGFGCGLGFGSPRDLGLLHRLGLLGSFGSLAGGRAAKTEHLSRTRRQIQPEPFHPERSVERIALGMVNHSLIHIAIASESRIVCSQHHLVGTGRGKHTIAGERLRGIEVEHKCKIAATESEHLVGILFP